jgi:Fe-S-cluster containining protein
MAQLPRNDQKLVQIVDAALAEAARKSGPWLVCRPGCTQCCVGPFSISPLDAARLQEGLQELARTDPPRAARVRERTRCSVARLTPDFPGDPATGRLFDDVDSETAFAEFADDEVCPALDPRSGTCDLYAWRPMTCRTFGPPVRSDTEQGLAVCELCYRGATDEEIAACEMVPDPDGVEDKLLGQMSKRGEPMGNTIVAFCLKDASAERRFVHG